MVFGGNGYPGSAGSTNLPARYQYPGNTDPHGYGLGGSHTNPVSAPFEWTGAQPGPNLTGHPAPRRFVMSMGPFRMTRGQVNSYVVGALWARAPSGGAQASLYALKAAKAQIQLAFNDCSIYGATGLPVLQLEQDALRLYPNPAQDICYISGDYAHIEHASIHIYRLNGQLLREIPFKEVQDGRISVDLHGLESGLYILKLQAKLHEQVFKLYKR
ncbi:MAG: T9SS type A sorting domain-containing protein [Bacteroidia bacterium]